MPYPIRIGLQIQPQHADYPLIRETAGRAEDLGVDILFNWDHFYPLSGDPDGKHFECWTMLAAWAEQTERVEIGALVSCAGYRNPDLLADMARTVDHISGGRLILGIGGGWFEKDYDQYGYEFGTPGSRLNLMAEYLPRIEQRWSVLNPRPTRDIPVLIGGGGERKTLKMVAQHAHIWHAFGDLATLQHKSTVLAQHCADLSRDPSTIERSTQIGPNTTVEQADALVDAGFSLFTLSSTGPDHDLSHVAEWLRWRDDRNNG